MERIKWFIVGLPESLREEKQPKDSGGTRRPARCRGRREGADSAPSPWRKTKPPASLPALPAPSRAAAEGNAFTPAHSACSQRFAALPARMRHALGMRSVRAGEKAGRKCCWRRTVARRAGGQVREGRGAGLRGSKGRAAPGGLRGGSAGAPLPGAAPAGTVRSFPPCIPAPCLSCGNSAPALANLML